ncbi:hypothetical protein B296_00029688 [Ensete ventricosum]|uniref:tryptophan synthase n=1 Tax=Ensete ventricosum TaxID=4639 RepID=A0A426Z0M2_ENSVE|nr:hypothetical protein B296_00029688 [Ensete ventricosum]
MASSATVVAVAPTNSCCFHVSSAKPTRFHSIRMNQPPKSCLRIRAHALGISETFSDLRRQGRVSSIYCLSCLGVAFIPYITAGDPDLSTTAEALKLLDCCGADIIELGLPYNNPVLDGPVIQVSQQTIWGCLWSNLLQYKWLIVPDLPLEESANLRREAAKKKVDMVLLTTPTTTKRRMKAISDASEGFIYLVSILLICKSVSSTIDLLLSSLVSEINTSKKILVQLSLWGADGVIVGSAIVKLLGEASSREEGLKRVESFVASLTAALPHGDHRLGEEHVSSFILQQRRKLWQGP